MYALKFHISKMLLYLTGICIVASAAAYTVLDESYFVVKSDADELRWADTYSVKATRIALLSGILEDFSAWKTNQSSRVDYNNGATKLITNLITEDGLPAKYEIHPETTEIVYNKIACHLSTDAITRNDTELDDILPETEYDYEAVGNETIEDVLASIFQSIEIEYNQEKRRTIWASYCDEHGWIPIKYEIKTYNMLLGSLVEHEVWSFFQYQTDDIDSDVFDTEKYDCSDYNTMKHTKDSEKVTKELLFIDPSNKEHVDHVFNHFKTKYNRQYAHEKEHAMRKAIFQKNMRFISSVNRKNLSYKLGVNKFTDRTPEEKQLSLGVPPHDVLKKSAKGSVPFPYTEKEINDSLDDLPKEYDMRVLGLVSPVKDQDMCGSCWTFAAAAVMEGALARVNGGKVLSLSSQAIVDCAYEDLGEYGAGGCNGGFDYVAYHFMTKHGLRTEQEYGPYKMRDGYCNIKNMTKTYSIKGYTKVTQESANAMKVAMVNHGPLYIYVDVTETFFSYSSGIFYAPAQACDPRRPNHAVILVGYAEQDGEPYWILKNSYGDYWGEDGYMRISARDDVCGVASNPTYPVL